MRTGDRSPIVEIYDALRALNASWTVDALHDWSGFASQEERLSRNQAWMKTQLERQGEKRGHT